jgi:hypothetical protein
MYRPLVEVSLEQLPRYNAEYEQQQQDDESGDEAYDGSDVHPIHFMTEAVSLRRPIIL